MAINITNCIVCDDEFIGTSAALYCSGRCRQSNYRGRKARTGYIYKLISNGEVVYVGQSITKDSLNLRVYAHQHGELKKVFDDHQYYKVDGEILNEVEAREIIINNPKYNKVLPRNTSYETFRSASKHLLPVISELIKSHCETYILGDENEKHVSYVKSCDIGQLKEKASQMVIISKDKFDSMVKQLESK